MLHIEISMQSTVRASNCGEVEAPLITQIWWLRYRVIRHHLYVMTGNVG